MATTFRKTSRRDAGDPGLTDVRHVLFDADGVIQHLPGGWVAAMEPYISRDRVQHFLQRTREDEHPTWAGNGDYLPLLSKALIEYGVTTPVEVVFQEIWHNIEIIEESLEIIDALRAAGYGVHLGTNQEQHRAKHMRGPLGYDELFDVSCYSYELRVAKPDPRFFTEAARRIGAPPETILFIDDRANNVDGARSAGLAAEQWDHRQGHDALLNVFARHGIHLTTDPTSG